MHSTLNAASPTTICTSNNLTSRRRTLAALLSAVVPGTGQMWLGYTRVGMVFVLLFVILAAMYWPLRLPTSYVGLVMLVLFTIGLNTAAALHVLTTRTESGLRSLRGWSLAVLSIASSLSIFHISWLCLAAGIHLYGVPSASMEPAIWKGDRIVVDLRAYRNARPHSPDIIVFRKFGLLHVKRVVGTGNETIEGKDGLVTVNRRRIEEPYVRHIPNAPRRRVRACRNWAREIFCNGRQS
jgi:signal peptidase I